MKTYTCKTCGDTYTEEIAPTGIHDYESVVTKEPTCYEEGVKTFTCKTCGNTYTESIPTTDAHIYDDGVVTKAPTCTEAGIKTYTCTICHKTKTEEISATGHHYDNGVITTPASCTTNGVKTYTCAGCGNSYTKSIKATGHHYDDGMITTPASCTAEGVKTYTCTDCGTAKTESIPMTDHDWLHHKEEGHNNTVVVKEAYDETVLEPRYICNGCGKSFKTEEEVGCHILAVPNDKCGSYYSDAVEVKIHHPAETKTVYVVDKKAYDECKHCHETRESK